MSRSRWSFAVFVASSIALLSSVSSAGAVEIGSRCAGTDGANITTSVNTIGQSVVVPFNGVITRWGISSPLNSGSPTQLITIRAQSSNWKVTAVTPTENVVTGLNEFAGHLAVTAGDRIGIGNSRILCASGPSDNAADVNSFSAPTVDSVFSFSSNNPGKTTAIWARVEPDADGDGAGDETQDLCPAGAKLQTACPTPRLSAKVISTAKSFSAVATTDIITTVFASGSVKLPAQKGKKSKTVTFTGKAVASAPGGLSTVKLAWPKAVKNALGLLSRSKTLKVKVSVTASGVLANDVKKFTVKLRGTK